MFKHLKRKRRYPVVVAGVCEMPSNNINFGLLSNMPWNMYPNWISSNDCSDSNHMAICL